MRFIVLSLYLAISATQAVAQEHWQQLPGAGQGYAVDVGSFTREGSILSARIRTNDVGSRIIVQQVQVRCASSQLRTIEEELYDRDTGRPLPRSNQRRTENDTAWPEYVEGSEGYAVLSSLCALARKQNILGPAEHSLRAA